MRQRPRCLVDTLAECVLPIRWRPFGCDALWGVLGPIFSFLSRLEDEPNHPRILGLLGRPGHRFLWVEMERQNGSLA